MRSIRLVESESRSNGLTLRPVGGRIRRRTSDENRPRPLVSRAVSVFFFGVFRRNTRMNNACIYIYIYTYDRTHISRVQRRRGKCTSSFRRGPVSSLSTICVTKTPAGAAAPRVRYSVFHSRFERRDKSKYPAGGLDDGNRLNGPATITSNGIASLPPLPPQPLPPATSNSSDRSPNH